MDLARIGFEEVVPSTDDGKRRLPGVFWESRKFENRVTVVRRAGRYGWRSGEF